MIALQSEEDRVKAKTIFENEGYHNIAYAKNNLELILHCETSMADVLLIDLNFPFMDCVSTLRYIKDHRLAKLIIAVADDWEKSRTTLDMDCVELFVAKPLEARKIIPGLTIGLSRMEKLAQLEDEYDQAEQELKNQKVSNYALQLVMDKMGLDEEKAKAYLRQAAAASGRDIREIYEIVYAVLCSRKSSVK